MDPSNPKNVKDLAIRILEWLACSYQVLKTHEILDGVTIHGTNTELSPQTRLRIEVLDLCRPLIENGPNGTVDFVHFSAKE
jgi:hypothetical protein